MAGDAIKTHASEDRAANNLRLGDDLLFEADLAAVLDIRGRRASRAALLLCDCESAQRFACAVDV